MEARWGALVKRKSDYLQVVFHRKQINITFVCKRDLSVHVKSVHLKEKPFKCSLCDYCAATKGMLSKHVKVVHLKEKPFKCAQCDYCASLKSTLSRHFRAVHSKEAI